MFVPVFDLSKASSEVQAVLGAKPTRVYPFGKVPKEPARPYSVWQTIVGEPLNLLAGRSKMDHMTTQHDVYADSAASLKEAVNALRRAYELHGHVVRLGGDDMDEPTGLHHFSFDVEWFVAR